MAVPSQANASVVVPGTAERVHEPVGRGESRRDRQAGEQHQGAHDAHRGSDQRRHEHHRERASASAKRTARRRAGGRVPIQRPPRSEPSAKQERAKPPCAREPCASANAGIATSTMPNAIPIANVESITVRTAAEPSAPALEAGAATSTARTDGASANQTVPTAAKPEAASMAAQGGATGDRRHDQRPDDEEHLLQPGLERVRGVAQPRRPSRLGQSARMHAPSGGSVAPAERGARDQRDYRRALRGEQRKAPEGGRVGDPERQQHAHLSRRDRRAARERPADGAGDRPRGYDNAGDSVRTALVTHQQHRRERAIPVGRRPSSAATTTRATPGAPEDAA